MTVKDVFWLSLFCVPYSISFAHIYVPYNDLHVQPDLSQQVVSRLLSFDLVLLLYSRSYCKLAANSIVFFKLLEPLILQVPVCVLEQ